MEKKQEKKKKRKRQQARCVFLRCFWKRADSRGLQLALSFLLTCSPKPRPSSLHDLEVYVHQCLLPLSLLIAETACPAGSSHSRVRAKSSSSFSFCSTERGLVRPSVFLHLSQVSLLQRKRSGQRPFALRPLNERQAVQRHEKDT